MTIAFEFFSFSEGKFQKGNPKIPVQQTNTKQRDFTGIFQTIKDFISDFMDYYALQKIEDLCFSARVRLPGKLCLCLIKETLAGVREEEGEGGWSFLALPF